MAELHHQGIVQVFDSDLEDEGHYFFVMECLPGGDLRQAVLRGRVAAEAALDLILSVGAALAFAHARGIIHRDIKPANIVLDAAGSPKLTDFDLVRAGDTTGGTRTGALGTFGYAAPELLSRPQDADARADVYGLGMTAIFALFGADPPPQETLFNAARFIDRLAVGAAVKPVLCHAIAWEIAERYPCVESFCEALGQARQARESQMIAVTSDVASAAPTDADAPRTSPANANAPEAVHFRDMRKIKDVGVVRLARVRSANKLQLYDQFHRLVMDTRGKQHSSVLNQFANAGDDPRLLSKEFVEQAKGTIARLLAVVDEFKHSNIRAWATTHNDFITLKECVRDCAVTLRDKLQQLSKLDNGDFLQYRAAFFSARELTRTCLKACRQLHFGIFAPIGLRQAYQGREISEFSFSSELRAVTDAGPFRDDRSLVQWHLPTPYELVVGLGNLKAADLAEAYVIWDEEVVDALRQLLNNARHAGGEPFLDPWSRGSNPTALALMWGRLKLEHEYLGIELRNRTGRSAREIDDLTRKTRLSSIIRSHGDLTYEDGDDSTLITKVAFPYAHTLPAF
jgi:hypothetical protein